MLLIVRSVPTFYLMFYRTDRQTELIDDCAGSFQILYAIISYFDMVKISTMTNSFEAILTMTYLF